MWTRTVVLAVLLLGMASCPGAAEARSLVIESFDARIVISADGSIQVAEVIRPKFTGTWNGIFRTIPVEYRTPQGMNYTLLLDILSITDDAGNPLKYERSRERHYLKLKVWVPGASDATRTVVLRYRVQNGLRFFDEHDELYWNVTGDEWQVPILAATAEVELPAEAKNLRAVAYTGAYGSREQAAIVDVSEHAVRIRMQRPLNFREGVTVAVGWDPGIVQRPTALTQAGFFLQSNWPFGLPLVIFVLMLGVWNAWGRDPRRRPIAPQYEPPEQLTPAELGTLVDNSPDLRDITSTLVDLAVRGYVQIREEERSGGFLGLGTQREYLFVLQRASSEWTELNFHERAVLEGLFSGQVGESVTSSDLEQSFYRNLPGIRDRIFERLLSRRYYLRRPDKIRGFFVFGGAAVGGVIAALGVYLSTKFGQSPFPALIAGLLSAAVVIGFGWIMPARTMRGSRALEGVLGFEEFLSRVEGDRFRRVVKTPELFEKFLPYAMALGVEQSWAKAFEGIYREPPSWYQGGDPHTFHPRSFVSDLGRMSTRTAAAMASAPRSSGGSGFSSGGSSGGGFGGGGGGGF